MTAAADPAVPGVAAPAVSVIVLLYRSADCVAECLRALPAAADATPYELVLVDNASPDDSLERAMSVHPGARVVRLPANLGFAGGVNAGLAVATGEYVMLLNPDTVPQPGAVDALVGFARRHPEHKVYGGRTVSPTGAPDPRSAWGLPSLWGYVCFATGLSTVLRRSPVFDPESLGRWQRDSVREVGAVSGCLLLAPRGFLVGLGGLDDTYFMYSEDIDLAVRARAHGARPVITPDAVVVHEGGTASTTGAKTVMVLRGKVTFVRRHWGGLRARCAVGLLTLGVGARAAGARLTGRGPQWREAWGQRGVWQAGWGGGD